MPFLVEIGGWIPPAAMALAFLVVFAITKARRRSLARSVAIGAAAALSSLVVMFIVGQLALAAQLGPDRSSAHQHSGLSEEERLSALDPQALTNTDAFAIGAAMPGSRGRSLERLSMGIALFARSCDTEEEMSPYSQTAHTIRNACSTAFSCAMQWRVSCNANESVIDDPVELLVGPSNHATATPPSAPCQQSRQQRDAFGGKATNLRLSCHVHR